MNSTRLRRSTGVGSRWCLWALAALSVVACAAASAPVPNDGAVKGLSLSHGSGVTTLDIRVEGQPRFSVEPKANPRRIVVSLPDAALSRDLLEAPTLLGPPGSAVEKALVLDGSSSAHAGGALVVLYLSADARSEAGFVEPGLLRVKLSPQTPDAPWSSLSPGAGSLCGGKVEALDVRPCNDGVVRLVLRGSAPLLYETRTTPDGNLEITFLGTEVAGIAVPEPPRSSNIGRISLEPVAGEIPATRLVVKCKEKVRCAVDPGSDNREVVVSVPGGVVSPPAAVVAGSDTAIPPLSVPGVASSGGTRIAQSQPTQTIPGPRRPGAASGPAKTEKDGRVKINPGPKPGVVSPPGFLTEGTLDLDFPPSAVRDVLQAIAHQADLDMVIDDGVDGDVAITMSEVTPRQALDAICALKGLAYVMLGQTYIVAKPEAIKNYIPEGDRVVMSYRPQITGADALKNLETLLTKLHPTVFIQLYEQTGMVLLAGNAEGVQAAMKTLREADAMQAGTVGQEGLGAPDLAVYSVQSGDPKKLGDFAKQVVGGGLDIVPRPGTQQLVIKGPRALVAKAQELLAELEREGGQVTTLTYKPTRVSANVVLAAVNEGYPGVVAKVTDDTLLVTGTEADAKAAIEYAKQVDLSLPGKDAVTEEYSTSSRLSRGLARLAREAFPASDLAIRVQSETRTITVSGATDAVAACLEKLQAWDQASPPISATKNVKVTYQDPVYLADTLSGLDLDPDLKIQPSGWVLGLSGPAIAVAEAEEIVEELDKASGTKEFGRDVVSQRRVLNYLDVGRAAEILETVFGHAMMRSPAQEIPAGPPAPTSASAPPSGAVQPFGQQGGGHGGLRPPASPGGGGAASLFGTPPDEGSGGNDGATSVPPAGPPSGPAAGAGTPPAGPATGSTTNVTPESAAATKSAPAAPAPPPAPVLVVSTDKATHSVLLTGPRWAVVRGMGVLDQMDVAPRQVRLDCTIADVNREFLEDKGIDWNWGSVTASGTATAASREHMSRDTRGGEGVGVFAGRQTISFGTLLNGGVAFRGAMTLEKTDGVTKLLANPNIRATDGETSRIHVGDTVRFPVLQPSGGAQYPVYTTEAADVGIILKFVPRITEDGHIALSLHAEASVVSGFVADLPQVRTRGADTNVIVHNGETIVIGGLITNEEVEILKRAPFLSEIPFFGQLFRHHRTEVTPQELVMFITPTIVTEDTKGETGEKTTSSASPDGWTAPALAPARDTGAAAVQTASALPGTPPAPQGPAATPKPADAPTDTAYVPPRLGRSGGHAKPG